MGVIGVMSERGGVGTLNGVEKHGEQEKGRYDNKTKKLPT